MLRIAILDDYAGEALTRADWSPVATRAHITVFNHWLSETEAPEALAPFDAICTLRERMALPGALLERLPNLKLITTVGARQQNLDAEAAARLGIKVSCPPQAGLPASPAPGGHRPNGTTELTWALILASARHLEQEMAAVRQGRWQSTVGMDLSGKTLGLLGLGRLGQAMLPVARAFSMKVIAWSTNLDPCFAAALEVEAVGKADLFARSDVLSIHLVLGERSRGLVGADDIARMKPGALLVNTSRGPIVDEAALIAAVNSGHIRAALDVYDQEPLPPDHPLRTAPNTTLSPHLGFVTPAMFDRVYPDTRDMVLAWLDETGAA